MRQKGRFIIFSLTGLFAAICLIGGLRISTWVFKEKPSPANESILGNVFEDWVMPDLGTIAQIDIADIGAGPEPELVICGGHGLYVFARTEKGYINRWRTKNIKVLPYTRRTFVLFDFDNDGTGELAFTKDNNLQLLNYRDGIFLESVIARDIKVRDMVAGRFFPGKAASLAVLTRDGVKMIVPGSPNTIQEILMNSDTIPTGSGGGKLAILSGTEDSGDVLLIAGNGGKVYFYRHGSDVKNLSLGEEDITRLETWDTGDAQGQYLILHTDSGIRLYSWSNGAPRLLWEKECRDESNAILADLDGRNGPELVFIQSEFDYKWDIVIKGSVRVYGITEDKLNLQWDSGNIKARQVATVDLNGDQLRELVVGVDNGARCDDTRKGRVELYGLTGSGRDGNWHRLWQGDNYEEGEFTLASGKLDGDGAEEMVVGNSGICDNKGTVRVFKTGFGIKKPFINPPKIDCNIEQNEIITDQSNLNLWGTVDMESQVSLVFNGEISPVTVRNNSFAVTLPLREGINKLEIHASNRAKGSTLMKYLVSRVKKEGQFYIPPWDDHIHLKNCLAGDTDGDGMMEVIAGDDSGRLNLFKFEHGKIKFFAQSERICEMNQWLIPEKIVDCNRNGYKEIYANGLVLEWDGRQYNRINIPEDAGFTHFGDINGDGIIDLINKKGVVYTWRGNTVVELARFTTPERGFVAVGDLDQDDIAEVITAEYIEDDYDPRPDSGITVQKWNGTGLTSCVTLKSGFGITHLVVLDMDGDGKEEVCTLGEVYGSEEDEDEDDDEDGANLELRLFKWHGKELVRDQHFPGNSLWINDLELKSGDLDGDGKPELLTYIFDEQKKIEGMVSICFKDGLPSMENLIFPTANRRLNNIALGDVDNDGKEEIIEASFSGTLKIYKWDGNKAVLTSKYP